MTFDTSIFQFSILGLAILKMLVLVGLGYLLHVWKFFKDGEVNAISSFSVWVCFPALIFVKIVSGFHPDHIPGWWLYPVYSILMTLVGMALGAVAMRFFKRSELSKEFIAACGFQNGAYLPAVLLAFLPAGDFRDQIMVSVFLFMMGFNLFFWVFVPSYFSGAKKMDWKHIFNSPVIAIIFSVASVFLFGPNWVPEAVFVPMEKLAEACFPLVLVVLGAFFGQHRGYHIEKKSLAFTYLLVKLVLLPALTLGVIVLFPGMPAFVKFLLFLEALMPTAMTLSLVGEENNANNRFLSGMILLSHLVAVLAIPLWFKVFEKYAG